MATWTPKSAATWRTRYNYPEGQRIVVLPPSRQGV
nr:MAG TPA: hypothetical protein [Caudoviricetes sp.]